MKANRGHDRTMAILVGLGDQDISLDVQQCPAYHCLTFCVLTVQVNNAPSPTSPIHRLLVWVELRALADFANQQQASKPRCGALPIQPPTFLLHRKNPPSLEALPVRLQSASV